jgi:hypothetical protein
MAAERRQPDTATVTTGALPAWERMIQEPEASVADRAEPRPIIL